MIDITYFLFFSFVLKLWTPCTGGSAVAMLLLPFLHTILAHFYAFTTQGRSPCKSWTHQSDMAAQSRTPSCPRGARQPRAWNRCGWWNAVVYAKRSDKWQRLAKSVSLHVHAHYICRTTFCAQTSTHYSVGLCVTY